MTISTTHPVTTQSAAARRPVTIALRSIRCIEETDEVGADEPYVLVTACDLSGLVPAVETLLYGPWSDVDKGETHATLPIPPGLSQAQLDVLASFMILRRPFWALDNRTARAIADPDRVILIVSLMENDDGKPLAARTLVKAAATASLANSMGMGRADRVAKLISDINGALQIPTGAPNFDDLVQSRELRLGTADVALAAAGQTRGRTLELRGDGGRYSLAFDIVAA